VQRICNANRAAAILPSIPRAHDPAMLKSWLASLRRRLQMRQRSSIRPIRAWDRLTHA